VLLTNNSMTFCMILAYLVKRETLEPSLPRATTGLPKACLHSTYLTIFYQPRD